MRDPLSEFLSNPVLTVRLLPVADLDALRAENERLQRELDRLKVAYSETAVNMLHYMDLLRENGIEIR